MSENSSSLERQKQMLHRIHRIQGQVTALERRISDEKSCEALVIHARAIERATASLITFMICCHLEEQLQESMQDGSHSALREIERLLTLIRL